jgi:CheY-like chemotaxis protein
MGKKILIVDDETEQIDFAVNLLKEKGYTPIGAVDGIEGMQKVKAEKPDLILMDILMPERSGMAMYKDLKLHKETRRIPVIIITGVAKTEDIDDLMTAQDKRLPPPDGHIEKPMNPNTVVRLIRKLLS